MRITADSLAPVRSQLRELDDAGALTPERATEAVQAWIAKRLPQLAAVSPKVTVRALKCPDTGRIYARAEITVAPMCMDVLVSEGE